MNIGSDYSQEYSSLHHDSGTYGVDLDGEGLVDAPKGGRLVNFSAEEVVLLCKMWFKVGMNPATDTYQTKDTYGARITDMYNRTCTTGYECTDRSLLSRWEVINTDCSKWSGVLAHVDKNKLYWYQ
jgi:hypothetical protein